MLLSLGFVVPVLASVPAASAAVASSSAAWSPSLGWKTSSWPACRLGADSGSRVPAGPPSDLNIPHCRVVSSPSKFPVNSGYPAPSSTGHLFNGAVGTPTGGQTFPGLAGFLRVETPTLYGSTQFVADWYMVNDYASEPCPDGGNLIQDGWAVTSWNNSSPQVFEFNSVNCTWEFFPGYLLANGTSYEFSVTSSGTTWYTWIYWNGAWNLLVQSTMPWVNAPYIEEQEEVFNNNSNLTLPYVPQHENGNSAVNVSGTWQDWQTQISTSTDSTSPLFEPYCIAWNSDYDYWTVGSGLIC